MSLGSRLPALLALGILVATWVSLPPVSLAGGPGVDVSRPRAALVKDLEGLATTCDGQRLFRFRDHVFGLLLRVSPDHARARGALKYRRDAKSGAWRQAADYRPPTDWTPAALPKAEARLGEVLASYRDAVLAALSSVAELPELVKEEQLEDLALLLPDDREVHQVRGDVEHGGRWIMPESIAALEQRAAFREAVAVGTRVAADGIRPSPELPASFEGEGFEIDLDFPFEGQEVKVGRRRVYGWTGETWTRESLRFVVVGSILTAAVVRVPLAAYMGPRETLLFPTEAVAKAWMERNPARATAKDLSEASAVGGLSIEDGTELVYFQSEPYRRTAALSSTVYGGIYASCPDDQKDRAWLRYGLGARIMSFVTDLRPAQSVSLEGTEQLTEGHKEPELPKSLAAWMAAAAKVLDDGGAERILRVLTVRTNAMRPSDLLVAYALAAYLREGRPEQYGKFVEASRTSDDGVAVIREGLGWDPKLLALRLRRWLGEQEGLGRAR